MLRVAALQIRRTLLTWSLLAVAVASPLGLQAREDRAAVVAMAELPRQAQQTYQLIRAGGPFPDEKDGVVFGNRERLLPGQQRGYYREYTVRTPGVRHRGARRIVCGGEQPRVPDACYYTSDHYASFRQIVEH